MILRGRKLAVLLGLGLALGPLTPLPANAVDPPKPHRITAGLAEHGMIFTTAPVKVSGDFDLAGLSYNGPAGALVELRASTDGRQWTPWYATGDGDPDGEGPDRGSPERRAVHSTPPVWTDKARFVQYRVTSPGGEVSALRVEAIDAKGHSESLTSRVVRNLKALVNGRHIKPAAAMTNQPPIVSRAEWGADESLRQADPLYGVVKMGIVHHTVNGNDYTPAEAPAMVRGIYAYHVLSNGWNDIGYNFLVDRYGTVYEGRYGGIDQPVVGAHSEGFNSVSSGMAMLGTFSDVAPPPAMVSALENLLAWRLDIAHVNPTGTVTLVSKGSSKYPAGTTVTLNTIIGHQDVSLTECPGTVAYGFLPRERTDTAAIGVPKIYSPTVSSSITGTATGGYSTATIGAAASEPLFWGATVTHFALGDVRHLAGAGLTVGIPWDGTDDSGRGLPGGTYQVSVGGVASDGYARAASVTVTINNTAEPKPATRLAGADRYGTAAAVADRLFPTTTRNVVIASAEGTHLVDSLVAAPLARAKGAPVLLTAAASLPSATASELTRLKPTDAWLIGGTAAISDTVAAAIAAKGINVHRVAGVDAPATAAAVAIAMGAPRRTAMLVSRDGAHLVDGLAAAGPAAALGRPILLTDQSTVPAATTQAMTALGTTDVVVIGGDSAVGDAVVAAVHGRRVAGDDRWSTAAAVAEAAIGGGLPGDAIVLASGNAANVIDALSAGAMGKAIVLTPTSTIPAVTWMTLYNHRATIGTAWVLGGLAAISDVPASEARHAINAP